MWSEVVVRWAAAGIRRQRQQAVHMGRSLNFSSPQVPTTFCCCQSYRLEPSPGILSLPPFSSLCSSPLYASPPSPLPYSSLTFSTERIVGEWWRNSRQVHSFLEHCHQLPSEFYRHWITGNIPFYFFPLLFSPSSIMFLGNINGEKGLQFGLVEKCE